MNSNPIPVRQRGRILAERRGSYLVSGEQGESLAEISGRMLFEIRSRDDYPTVGDYVDMEYFGADSPVIIHGIFPRHSVIRRKSAGRDVEHQLLAANIDRAFIVQSLDHDFNPARLERYLVMVGEGGIEPALLLSKRDLVSAEELSEKITRINSVHPSLSIHSYSSKNREGIDEIRESLLAGKTYCFLGSSGVGKTTLLNILLGEERFSTSPVREADSRGRHTTVERRIAEIPGGSFILDTPGLRELGNFDIEDGLTVAFPEIERLARQCRFIDCTHEHEPGCAVKGALDNGKLDPDHFRNYRKLQREAAFYETSAREKREKDKKFGKMVRDVMKEKKKNKR